MHEVFRPEPRFADIQMIDPDRVIEKRAQSVARIILSAQHRQDAGRGHCLGQIQPGYACMGVVRADKNRMDLALQIDVVRKTAFARQQVLVFNPAQRFANQVAHPGPPPLLMVWCSF